jgi:hypothetical protein
MKLTRLLPLVNLALVLVAFGPGMFGYDYPRPARWLVQVPVALWLVASVFLIRSVQKAERHEIRPK